MLKSLIWAKAVAEKKATLMTSLERIFAVRRVWEGECEEMYENSGQRTYEGRVVERRWQKGVPRDFMDGQRGSPQRIAQELFCFGDLSYNDFMIISQAIFLSSL